MVTDMCKLLESIVKRFTKKDWWTVVAYAQQGPVTRCMYCEEVQSVPIHPPLIGVHHDGCPWKEAYMLGLCPHAKPAAL